jgi:hypothetical protein
MRLSYAQHVEILGIYLHLFRRRQFQWRIANLVTTPGLVGVDATKELSRELTESELRECINDICEGLRGEIAMRGTMLTDEDHNALKDALVKKIMGPTRSAW